MSESKHYWMYNITLTSNKNLLVHIQKFKMKWSKTKKRVIYVSDEIVIKVPYTFTPKCGLDIIVT